MLPRIQGSKTFGDRETTQKMLPKLAAQLWTPCLAPHVHHKLYEETRHHPPNPGGPFAHFTTLSLFEQHPIRDNLGS